MRRPFCYMRKGTSLYHTDAMRFVIGILSDSNANVA